MKYLIAVLLVFTFMTFGCKKSTTEPNDNINGINTHATVNVKTASEYFNFSTNSGSVDAASVYDIVFFSVMWTPPGAPVTISDPRFQAKSGLSIAVLNNTNLKDVTDIPAVDEFLTNFLSKEGEWYDETELHIILPKDNIYIVNTTDGKFPAFHIKSYYDEIGESGVFTIEWKYLSE